MNTVWEWPGRYPNVRIIRLTGTPEKPEWKYISVVDRVLEVVK